MGEIAKIIEAEVVTIDDAARLHNVDPDAFRRFVMDGDISSIRPEERPALVMALCHHIGIDPIEQPFLVLRDGKREVLYATRSCTSALCRERKIDRKLISVEERTIAGQKLIVAHARATLMSTGRSDEATGVVPVMQEDVEWFEDRNGKRRKKHKGWRTPNPNEAANLYMKAETKAKRRAVLDLVGLGITDESEIETIKGARVSQINMATGELQEVQPLAIGEGESKGKPEAKRRGDLGPRCSGKSVGIAEGNDRRIGELAELVQRDMGTIWRAALQRAAIDLEKYVEADGEQPCDPWALTVDDGKRLREWLDGAIAKKRGPESSESGDPNSQTAQSASVRKHVIETYDHLCNVGECTREAWRDNFAAWAGLESWPDQPSDADWHTCAEGLGRFTAGLEAG